MCPPPLPSPLDVLVLVLSLLRVPSCRCGALPVLFSSSTPHLGLLGVVCYPSGWCLCFFQLPPFTFPPFFWHFRFPCDTAIGLPPCFACFLLALYAFLLGETYSQLPLFLLSRLGCCREEACNSSPAFHSLPLRFYAPLSPSHPFPVELVGLGVRLHISSPLGVCACLRVLNVHNVPPQPLPLFPRPCCSLAMLLHLARSLSLSVSISENTLGILHSPPADPFFSFSVYTCITPYTPI